ncbi:hypothetical protein [Arthrobacter sp. yr096]|uniref:hypothetical protein n=1 Tax=Arthrobacter sp. yr096 TaxID=1761750 RepID=UPI00210A794D|nr:hypothetical protein [Arthrobacter sp. yr096]
MHPTADYLWAVAAVLLWLGIATLARQPLLLEGVDTGARRTLFQTLATLAGATAGLTLTSVSMLINVLGKKAAPGQRELPLEKLTATHRRQIGEVFLFAIPGLGLLVVAALATIVLEGGAPTGLWIPEAVVFVLAFASVLALLRVAWALRRVLAIATA